MITFIVTITSKENKIDETRALLASFVPKATAEEGCIQYELYNNNEALNEFVMIEKWSSQETLNQHLVTDYLDDFRERFSELLDKPMKIISLNSIA